MSEINHLTRRNIAPNFPVLARITAYYYTLLPITAYYLLKIPEHLSMSRKYFFLFCIEIIFIMNDLVYKKNAGYVVK